MSRSFHSRTGSALLIVLGFLAFMVVSAVAFSVYMRMERMPSSAYRRSVAARHLVKAALAEAISQVDLAVGSDPFPGLTDPSSSFKDNYSRTLNRWHGRVYVPPEPESNQDDPDRALVPSDESDSTVSVLNLEALGYLPPSLVNDARYISRSSWAARWQSLPFDGGRYAFCAVNVSDCLDINRLYANKGRTSSGANRISLAPLFPSSDNSVQPKTEKTEKFDELVSEGTRPGGTNPSTPNAGLAAVDTSYPFVSLMDYNLAAGAKGGEIIRSPFYEWIRNTGENEFYSDKAPPGEARRQLFVTDSWFPASSHNKSVVEVEKNDDSYANSLTTLGSPDKMYGQPFTGKTLKSGLNISALDITSEDTAFWWHMAGTNEKDNRKYLSVEADSFMLLDYIDGNDVPTSLAIPCVERVPMIAAVGPNITVTPTIQATLRPGTGLAPDETDYCFSGTFFNGAVDGVGFFPFKRGKHISLSGYTAKVLVRVVFAVNGFSKVRASTAFADLRPKDTEWNTALATAAPFQTARNATKALVLSACNTATGFSPQALTSPSVQESDTAFQFGSVLQCPAPSTVLLTKTDTKTQNPDTKVITTTTTYQFNVDVYDADGKLMGLPALGAIPDTTFNKNYGAMQIQPYIMVWVRVENANGDVVDLAPAIADDDQEYNGVNNSFISSKLGYDGSGRGTPLLVFAANAGANFTVASLANAATTTFSSFTPTAYFTVDPRFNWAPEDWIPSSKNASLSDWSTVAFAPLGADGRDSDPFLFVSNQGYLQSMGELAFLPRVSDFHGNVLLKSGDYNGVARTMDCGVGDLVNGGIMWTSYRTYETGGEKRDDVLYTNMHGDQSGYFVNPYTDNKFVQRIVFANTPYDWWAAGTNWNPATSEDCGDYFAKKKDMATSFSSQKAYCFTDGGLEAVLTSDEVIKIAEYVCNAIRANPKEPWQTVYDGLKWEGENENEIFGIQLKNPLHSVDRKFLHAYWRECFSDTQQLFLIFVRAESTLPGGSGEGQGGQLGGRAVALVWRDRNPPSTNSGGVADPQNYSVNRIPHRTRVLFYHQFD